MARRVLGAFAATGAAMVASLVLATPASAHTPVSSADCIGDKAVLTLKLTQYKGSEKDKQNTVVVKDGEKELVNEKFGDKWGEKKWTLDGTVKHTFVIEVRAVDTKKPKQNFDYDKTHVVEACVKTPPTTTTKPATTTTTPVATSPEVPSSSEVPPTTSTTPVAPAGSAPEPPLAATGASPMWLLLSGLGLVGAGAGTLLFLRRRRSV